MKSKIHAYKRDNINTDEIIPARYLNIDEEKELAKHAMEGIDNNFIRMVEPGDFIVAGNNFGCGSSREHAVWALRGAGIKGVIAKSFARIFYRNAINNGFLAVECRDIDDDLVSGDEINIDFEQGYFTVNQKKYNFLPIPAFVKNIMEKGGLLNTIVK